MSIIVVNFGGQKQPCKGCIRIDGTNAGTLREGLIISIEPGTHVLEFEKSIGFGDVVDIFTETTTGVSSSEDFSIKSTFTINDNSILKFIIVTNNIGEILAKPTYTIKQYSVEEYQSQKIMYENNEKAELSRISQNSSKSGCYIATAVYGSYDCPSVWLLRRYRDETLAKSWSGRLFIHFYYTVSPLAVRLFGKSRWFHKLWKPKLDHIVSQLREKGVSDLPYDDQPW